MVYYSEFRTFNRCDAAHLYEQASIAKSFGGMKDESLLSLYRKAQQALDKAFVRLQPISF